VFQQAAIGGIFLKCQVRNFKATLARNYKLSQNQENVSGTLRAFHLAGSEVFRATIEKMNFCA